MLELSSNGQLQWSSHRTGFIDLILPLSAPCAFSLTACDAEQ
jgi:hypothetical protein